MSEQQQPPVEAAKPVPGVPPDAPAVVTDLARAAEDGGRQGTDITADEERGAVYWLLQPQRSPRYTVEAFFDTPQGRKSLVFLVRSLDGETIDEIERRHTNATTGRIDDLSNNADTVAEAVIKITDSEGGVIDPKSGEFLAGQPTSGVAFKARFHWQPGVLAGVASRVREIGGWSPDRVGSAQRALVDVTGESSAAGD